MASETETTMTRDDVMRETVKHVRRVAALMLEASHELERRAVCHDDSKFSPEEFEAFAAETPALRGLTYWSDEYKASLARLGPALQHHYAANRHHPEHFGPNGVKMMNLLDLIEMLADWKAATERHANGSLLVSIGQNASRIGYDSEIRNLLISTARDLGWLPPPADSPHTRQGGA
jgi:hypothetical protein